MRKARRNPYLTKGMECCLLQIRDGESHELVFRGGEVWVDEVRFAPATLQRLLQYCLLHNDSFSEIGSDYELYELNGDGRGVLNDPAYVPIIVRPETLREVKRQANYHKKVMRQIGKKK